jgi:SAM-dependent methyltransferase
MSDMEPILRLEQMPIQQNRVHFSREEALNCPKGDIVLAQDRETGIVHNAAFDQALMVYDEHYQNEQACSDVFKKHLEDVAVIVQRYVGGGSVVEVGCGKGTFLEILRSHGCDAVGVDPAYEGSAPYVIKSTFSGSLNISADVVVLRHILEHIPQPLAFLNAIAEANGRRGLVYIEVPCLDWIRKNGAWFDIYYEHANYFRQQDFGRCFAKVLESGKSFGGQYIYAVADLSSLKTVSHSSEQFRFGPDFMAGITTIISKLEARRSRKAIIWGGASKGVIFAQHLQRAGNFAVEFAIDINPAKQGGFFPGTGLPVMSPDEGLQLLTGDDVVIVMNSNYLNEIRKHTGDRFSYWVVDGAKGTHSNED